MKQPDIEIQDDAQVITEQTFFGADAVETAQRVVPLAQVQDENAVYTGQVRSPHIGIGGLKNRFSPSVLGLILLLTIGGLGGIGTLLFNQPAAATSVAPASEDTPTVEDNRAVIQTNPSEVISVAEISPIPPKINVASQAERNSRNKQTYRATKNTPVYVPAARQEEYESEDDDDDRDDRKERNREVRRERKNNNRYENFIPQVKRAKSDVRRLEQIFGDDDN